MEVEHGRAYQPTPEASTQAARQNAQYCYSEYAGRRGFQTRKGGALCEAGEA